MHIRGTSDDTTFAMLDKQLREKLFGFLDSFRLLPTADKRFAVLPGLAHSTPLGIHRRRMWEAVDQFLAS